MGGGVVEVQGVANQHFFCRLGGHIFFQVADEFTGMDGSGNTVAIICKGSLTAMPVRFFPMSNDMMRAKCRFTCIYAIYTQRCDAFSGYPPLQLPEVEEFLLHYFLSQQITWLIFEVSSSCIISIFLSSK